MSPIMSQILIALLCGVFGFIAGALLIILWTDRGKENPSPTALPEGLDAEKHEPIARLWRDTETGQLLTELDGEILSIEKPPGKSTQKLLMQAALDWATWLTGHSEKPVQAEAKVIIEENIVNPPSSPPLVVAAPIVNPIELPLVDLPGITSPVKKNVPVAPVKPVSFFRALVNPNPPVNEESLKPPHNMVEDIDAILQEMLEESPLKDRNIHLKPDPPVGVIVWVGKEHFKGVDSVTDPEVQAIIRKAVSTWEQNNEMK